MFAHNFKYSLKVLLKNKMLLFWTFAFPIILGTFFNMAFSDIEKSEKLDTISIAVVELEKLNQNEYIKSALQKFNKSETENGIFDVTYQTEEKAQELLEKENIVGYLKLEKTPKIVVKKSGINETVFKNVVDEILESIKLFETAVEKEIMKEDLEKNRENVMEYQIQETIVKIELELSEMEINTKDISNSNLSYTMIEYYTLIAMACLYGGILGMYAVTQNLANMSSKGKRISVSNSKKGVLIMSSLASSFLTQVIGIILLFLYTIFVLKVDFGPSLTHIIILALAGCLAGLSIGIAVSALVKKSENAKTGIIIAITMTGCFLSGMMGITMKYIVDTKFPILNKINPASMITDGFYSLYYYETKNRYFFDLMSLILFSVILISLSMLVLRRQKYDSV